MSEEKLDAYKQMGKKPGNHEHHNSGPGQERKDRGEADVWLTALGAEVHLDHGRSTMKQGMQESSRSCKKQGN